MELNCRAVQKKTAGSRQTENARAWPDQSVKILLLSV
jgi:hypothetical protein